MNKKLFTAVAAILLAGASFGQDYVIKSNVKIDGLPPEYAAFGESEKVTTLKGEKSKVETSNMMGSSTEVFDGTKVTVLTEQMGSKTGYTATKEEMEKSGTDTKKEDAKPKVELVSDKKTVAGYECSKALVTVTDKDKKETKITVWYTEKIKKPVTGKKKKGGMSGGNFDFKEVPGYPMAVEFDADAQGMKIKYSETVSEVSTAKVDDSAFIVSTDGYKMITYQQFMEEMKKAMASEK